MTQMHQGYGFVEFMGEEDADYSIKIMNMIKLYGKPIRVNKVCAFLFFFIPTSTRDILEMIWTCLICSNFIIFGVVFKQVLAQHIPLLAYTSLPSPFKFQDGFTEPFFTGVAMHTCLYSFFATVQGPFAVVYSSVCRFFVCTNADNQDEYMTF